MPTVLFLCTGNYYRSRYAEFLKSDFPRLPLTGNVALFRSLARLGDELVALQLLESPKLDHPAIEFLGGRNPEIEKLAWSKLAPQRDDWFRLHVEEPRS